MEDELRQKAKELLETGQVKLVIGYEAGSVPFKCTPSFARTPEDADRLIWNPTCVNNLAVYLPQAVGEGKVGVVIKPCDAKSVVELLKEHKISKDDVTMLVVGCPGVLNLDALSDLDLNDIRAVEWQGDDVVAKTVEGEVTIPRERAFLDKCLTCDIGSIPLEHVAIGEMRTRSPVQDADVSIEEYESMSPEARRAFWARHFARCIRCYACRAVCPGCYCKECFVDKAGQMWALRSADADANWFFHMSRAMHTAGRCVGCGECERACPMGIPLSLLGRKIEKEVEDMFGAEAGEDPEAAQIMGTFDGRDPDPCPEE